MRLLDHVFMVGSGALGLSDPGDCHVYLIDAGGEYILIDSGGGGGVERIIANIRKEGIDPDSIHHLIVTHAHRDHANGCIGLQSRLPIRIGASRCEAQLLACGSIEDMGLDRLGLGNLPRETTFPPFSVDDLIEDGQILQIGHLELTAIEVPGHNPGCLCLFTKIDGLKVLFAGDVINCGGVISLGNWPGSNLQDYQKGMKKLAGLEIDALFPGHLMWTLSNGQNAIDLANRAFAGLFPPPNINMVP